MIQPPQRLHRTVLAVACFAGLALAAPAGAFAAGTVTLTGADSVVVFNAAPGVANDVTVTTAADSVRISDAGDTITEAVDPCVNDGPNAVICNGIFANWELAAGDLDDKVHVSGPLTGTVVGQDGADQLSGGEGQTWFEGGNGADLLTGGSGDERFDGQGGHDTIVGNAGNDSARGTGQNGDADAISLGSGADVQFALGAGNVVDLGPDSDTLVFATGASGPGTVDGGAGNDRVDLTTDSLPASVTIDLNGSIVEKPPALAIADSLKGFENVGGTMIGGDTITGTDGPNSIRTGIGYLAAFIGVVDPLGNGDDVVDPRAGSDGVVTGAGNDTIALADGYADSADCGPGADTVTADQFDVLDGCESVTVKRVRAAIADLRPPACRFTSAPAKVKRPAVVRGYGVRFRCDEQVTVSGKLVVTPKRGKGGSIRIAKVGDLVLAERSVTAAPNATARLTLKPARKLAKALPAKFSARVVIEARDEFGNRRALTRKVKVSAPKKRS